MPLGRFLSTDSLITNSQKFLKMERSACEPMKASSHIPRHPGHIATPPPSLCPRGEGPTLVSSPQGVCHRLWVSSPLPAHCWSFSTPQGHRYGAQALPLEFHTEHATLTQGSPLVAMEPIATTLITPNKILNCPFLKFFLAISTILSFDLPPYFFVPLSPTLTNSLCP